MRLPRLPLPSAIPTRLARLAGLLPDALPARLMARIAGQVLKEALDTGELDLLQHRVLAVQIMHADLELRFTQENGRLRGVRSAAPADATITATAEDLLLLLTRQIDPDTLFFQRRLRLSGDTELGLAIKNLLDTVTIEQLPPPLALLLERLSDGGRPGDPENR